MCVFVVCVCLCGVCVCVGLDDRALVAKIRTGKFACVDDCWTKLPKTLKDLLRDMLKLDPPSRITCAKALKSPYCVELEVDVLQE